MSTCDTCKQFSVKSDYHGYCLSSRFNDSVDVSYRGNSIGEMPSGSSGVEDWMRQQAEIETWARIRIDGRCFGCIFHEKWEE